MPFPRKSTRRPCTDSDGWFRGSADGGENVGGGFGLDERPATPVVLGDVAFDRRLQVDAAGEGALPQPAPGERREEAFDRAELRGRGRGEVKRRARVASQPGAHLRMFVGRDVVQDRADRLAGRDGSLDGVEEPDELTVRWRRMPQRQLALVDNLFNEQDRDVAAALQREPSSHIPGVANAPGIHPEDALQAAE